jgi:hypothetical protein
MKNTVKVVLLLAILMPCLPLRAQWQVRESVLSAHTWYKIGVTEDGVYGVDYTTLQSLGVDVQSLNPDRIRLFGNRPGLLPEGNGEARFDDLTEIAIQVTGAEDGTFDPDDKILFYGKGPVDMKLNILNFFNYERNPYTDTLYYYLCVDSDDLGLRMPTKPSAQVGAGAALVNSCLDYICHESEEMSPYASGRTWYGDLTTGQEGYREFVFDIPDLDISKLVWIDTKELGRCKEGFTFNLKVNDSILVNSFVFDGYRDREFGKEHNAKRSIPLESGPIVVRFEINPTSSNPMLYIDYFTLAFWRGLKFRNHEMAFRVIPSQVNGATKIQVGNANAGVHCWEVTDPMLPAIQQVELKASKLSFGVTDSVEHRYHLFDMSGVKQIASVLPIPNQNLHGISDAELLIVTPREFWDQSEALAAFHREMDAMNCVLVDVKEIYNEFGTGVPDPTAIRDFIRMVYLRSNGNLKYVLLMGKGTHDFRRIKGVDNNFVPTYQLATNPHLEVYSMCTDDYYALMDEDEGSNCDGQVDLGVGRIPITTPEEGDAMVEKIRHYADLSQSHGLWKNNHLLMADNDINTYVNYSEELDDIIDSQWPNVNTKKVYLDSYPLVNTPSGARVPQANETLMDFLGKGVGVMSYTGHGGVKALATEQVFSISDVQSMDNYDKLPFVHTATCEFSKFDNPTMVSAGELMILNPRGGAIAMLTTVRPTIAQTNQVMSKSVHRHLYEMQDQNTLRFGDIYRVAKTDAYMKSNMVYVLFGDPALRFFYPTRDIRTESLKGEDIRTVKGFVKGSDDLIDNNFNGVLEFRVYDQKSQYTTLGQMNGDPLEYSFYDDVLFEGKASVTNGHFEFQFPVPSDINHGHQAARLSYYAYDSIRRIEANGAYDNVFFTTPASVDHQGPEIHLYWNTPDFENGSCVARKGTLYADLFDEHGIYHYNVSIGRDLVLRSNISAFDNLVLNENFEPALDDYQRGRVSLNVGELQDGIYTFTLKAWDTQNNSSEAEIIFEVRQGVLLSQVHNAPNPFTDETWFSFAHGDMTDHLSVVIEIFDVMGRKVAMFQKETDATDGVVPPIQWNGGSLRSGLYLYRITVTNSKGKSWTISQRMIKK